MSVLPAGSPSAPPDGDPADGLTVSGGPGSVGARVDDLLVAADLLRTCAGDLGAVAVAAGRVLADPGLLATGVLAPPTFAAAEHALSVAAGPRGVAGAAAAAVGLAARLTAVAAGYAAAERGAREAVRTVDLAAGRLVGRGLAVGAVLALPQLLQAAAAAGVVAALHDDLPAGAAAGPRDPAAGGAGTALAGGLAGLGDGAEHVVAAVPGVLDGLLDAVPAAGLLWGLAAGTRWPPRTLPQTSDLLVTGAGAAGLLRESGRVSSAAGRPRVVAAPRGVADLAGLVAGAYPDGTANGPRPGTVRVTRLDRADGSRTWVVAVPGTQVWQPRTGTNPLDVTSDVRSMAGRRTAAAAAVVSAMESAGVRPGEPVCLVGHSLGGMVAAGLAADDAVRTRFRVQQVVTLGSPTGPYAVGRDVGVLSLEHDDDLVPRLDGAPNPGRGAWTTVHRRVTPDGVRPDVLRTHDVGTYAVTAAQVDGSTDPALVAARARLAPFLPGAAATATTFDVTGARVLP